MNPELSILMRPTDRTAVISGLPCRLWTGRTNRGAAVSVLVHRIMIETEHADQLDGTLLDQPTPTDPALVGSMEIALLQAKKDSSIIAQAAIPMRDVVATLPRRPPSPQFEYEP